MNERPTPDGQGIRGRDALAADLVTIWQSELAGLACDRETAEHAHAALAGWLAASSALWAHEPPLSGADAPPRPAAAGASPDAGPEFGGPEFGGPEFGGPELDRSGLDTLRRRVDELERLLARQPTR